MGEPLSKLIIISLMMLLPGCFAPKAAEPELNRLTEEVLKRKEGIQIQVIPMDKIKVTPVKDHKSILYSFPEATPEL